MKNKKYLIMALSLLLCATIVLPFAFIDAGAEAVNFDEGNIGTGFKGKKISILGDSISTYEGVSNDSKANSTIGGNAVYYTENNDYGVVREDTWWQQAIDKLDMELCVNNSWSGSSVMGTDATDDYTAAWANRCQQLHTASANPDIIAVYLGTNDVKNMTTGFSTFANNKEKMLSDANGTGSVAYKFSYYIRMVNKMMTKYPSAQIYLFTLLPNESQNDTQVRAMEQYNQSIRDLVTYYQGQSKKVYLVDLYNDTSITRDFEVLEKHLANTLHPNDAGMDAITNCFLSSLVHNSGWAQNPANWRKVEYDLTDVYVSGGQINTKRFSSSTDNPFSVSLLPTRPEYGMEVTVKAHKKDAGEEDTTANWVDITSTTYSGGTVFIRKINYNTYDKIKITAKAVYQPKNFRWELGSNGLNSCVMDGTNYHITGSLTQNNLNLETGSYANGTFTDTQYSLNDTVLLRNEEPWVIEWKSKGALSKSQFLFSGTDTAATRSNNYIYTTGSRMLFIGYRNGYRSAYWNYGIRIPDKFVFDANTAHTYRLANRVNADGSNMVYLYVDNEQIGALENYYIGSTAQTGELATQNWLSGRDLEFSYMGVESFYLNDSSIEYIQVWEGGGFDTLRLQQLVNEYNDELKTTMASATNFAAYKSAVEAGQAYLSSTDENRSQEQCDAHVKAIEDARNNLTKTASATKIYGVELINGGYVPANMPAGLKIVTTPDVQKVQIGNTNQTLLTNTSSIQTIKIDGVDTEVKVWLVSFKRDKTAAIEYRIHAATSSSAEITSKDDTDSKASVLFTVPHVAKWITSIEITKAPTKTVYLEGEQFDPTGMVVTAHYADGTSAAVTGYTYITRSLYAEETAVTISYTDTTYGQNAVTASQPIEVISSVYGLKSLLYGTEAQVYGYYVGVADEGLNSDKEILLKDTKTDDIIAVRNFPGTFPEYGLNYGDEIQLSGTYKLDGTTNTPNKAYFDCDGSFTVRSKGNTVEYALTNTVKVSSWAEMQALFQVGTINEYTYIEFTGTLFMNQYTGTSDKTPVYRIHMNDAATEAAHIKPDNTRSVTLRSNVMEKNLGADWLEQFDLEATGKWRGDSSDKGLVALYTGANGSYFQLTILDPDWINIQ